jgi:hypothetical protein
MSRPTSIWSANGTCNTALRNATEGDDPPVTLGVSFLRSVYLAYRFPTPNCPRAFYGFAYPKGANRTEAQKRQKPRTIPAADTQCLNFGKTPSTAPSFPTKPVEVAFRTLDGAQRTPLPGEKTWKVYGGNEDEWVVLKDADSI